MQPEELDRLLLGADRRLRRDEVAAGSGVPAEVARAFWAALGLPEVAPTEAAYTERDVAALRTALAVGVGSGLDLSELLVQARVMGQGLARLAEAQVEGLVGRRAELEALLRPELVEGLEQLVVHVWRRQLAAAVGRSLATEQPGQPVLCVGFADLVEFTLGSRQWDSDELGRVLERFEAAMSLRVTSQGGRVVKTLGDEVLFVCQEPAAAAEVALATVAEADPDLPQVRVGLACGEVLTRLGDVFGEPVNLASRLTAQARPGTALVDLQLAEALRERPGYELVPLRARSVGGYRHLRPHVLRRAH